MIISILFIFLIYIITINPAMTIVEECSKEETGVGLSIAPINHEHITPPADFLTIINLTVIHIFISHPLLSSHSLFPPYTIVNIIASPIRLLIIAFFPPLLLILRPPM